MGMDWQRSVSWRRDTVQSVRRGYRKFSPLFIGNPYISWGKQWFPVKMFPSTNQVVNLFGHINC